MLIKDANFTINVKDIGASISFYQSIGLTIKNRWGNHYAQLSAPGLLHLQKNLVKRLSLSSEQTVI